MYEIFVSILWYLCHTQGAYNFLLQIPRTIISISDPTMLTYMNGVCGCGQTYTLNGIFVITYCPACGAPFFQDNTIGLPQFGVIRTYAGELRWVISAI